VPPRQSSARTRGLAWLSTCSYLAFMWSARRSFRMFRVCAGGGWKASHGQGQGAAGRRQTGDTQLRLKRGVARGGAANHKAAHQGNRGAPGDRPSNVGPHT
jgi:hypothetical protein